MTFRFVSNVDGTDFAEATRDLDPARDAVHRRVEDVHHARDDDQRPHGARPGCSQRSGDERGGGQALRGGLHQRRRRSPKFGIDTANMFGFWDWVGGRYSMDSAIGLSLMIAIGPEQLPRDARRLPRDGRAFPHRAVRANLPVLMGLLGVWYHNFFGAETAGGPALRPVPEALPGLPAAARHGEQRQVASTLDGKRGRLRDRPDRLGRAGHQRPARVLPAHPPGHEADPVRLHRLRASRSTRSASITTADGQRLRPDRGAGVRQDRATRSRPRASPDRQVPHRVVRGQPPVQHDPGSSGSRPRVLGKLVALYEHRCSRRARSGTSTRSTSGASSSARCWPSASSPSWSRDEPGARPRQLDQRADPPLPARHADARRLRRETIAMETPDATRNDRAGPDGRQHGAAPDARRPRVRRVRRRPDVGQAAGRARARPGARRSRTSLPS